MPLYEYYCRSCGVTFELLRPMSRSSEPADCPAGHSGAQRTVSLFATSSQQGIDGQPTGGSAASCSSCAASSCTTCGR